MYDLKETLCTDLDQYAKKGTLTGSDLEMVHKMTDTIKNIDKITMMEEQGSSYDGNWTANGSYGNGMMNGGYSGYRGSRNSGMNRGNSYGDYYDNMESRMRREMNY